MVRLVKPQNKKKITRFKKRCAMEFNFDDAKMLEDLRNELDDDNFSGQENALYESFPDAAHYAHSTEFEPEFGGGGSSSSSTSTTNNDDEGESEKKPVAPVPAAEPVSSEVSDEETEVVSNDSTENESPEAFADDDNEERDIEENGEDAQAQSTDDTDAATGDDSDDEAADGDGKVSSEGEPEEDETEAVLDTQEVPDEKNASIEGAKNVPADGVEGGDKEKTSNDKVLDEEGVTPDETLEDEEVTPALVKKKLDEMSEFVIACFERIGEEFAEKVSTEANVLDSKICLKVNERAESNVARMQKNIDESSEAIMRTIRREVSDLAKSVAAVVQKLDDITNNQERLQTMVEELAKQPVVNTPTSVEKKTPKHVAAPVPPADEFDISSTVSSMDMGEDEEEGVTDNNAESMLEPDLEQDEYERNLDGYEDEDGRGEQLSNLERIDHATQMDKAFRQAGKKPEDVVAEIADDLIANMSAETLCEQLQLGRMRL